MQREARRVAVQALSDQDFERLHDLFVQERAQDGLTLRKLRAPDHGADSLALQRAGAVEEVRGLLSNGAKTAGEAASNGD